MSSQSMYEIISSGDKPLFVKGDDKVHPEEEYEGGDQGIEDFNRSDPSVRESD